MELSKFSGRPAAIKILLLSLVAYASADQSTKLCNRSPAVFAKSVQCGCDGSAACNIKTWTDSKSPEEVSEEAARFAFQQGNESDFIKRAESAYLSYNQQPNLYFSSPASKVF